MSKWQPISTAPKDGTPILLFDPHGEWQHESLGFTLGRGEDDDWEPTSTMGVGAWEQYTPTQGGWAGYYNAFGPANSPTHWMPLPPPPDD